MMGLMVSGCAIEPSYRAQKVQPAFPAMVSDCLLLGGVSGTSDLSYLPMGKQLAKYRAMDEAAKLGATHIVWTDIQSHLYPYAKGRAYQCVPWKSKVNHYAPFKR